MRIKGEISPIYIRVEILQRFIKTNIDPENEWVQEFVTDKTMMMRSIAEVFNSEREGTIRNIEEYTKTRLYIMSDIESKLRQVGLSVDE